MYLEVIFFVWKFCFWSDAINILLFFLLFSYYTAQVQEKVLIWKDAEKEYKYDSNIFYMFVYK